MNLKCEVTWYPVICRLTIDNILIPENYRLHKNGACVGWDQICSSGGTTCILAKQNIEVNIDIGR